MTEQEAIKKINMMEEALNFQRYDADECSQALQMAVEALEKQIPKQVIHYHHCPKCSNGLPAEKITEDYCSCCFKWKYCPNCGQVLKWE